MGKQTLGILGGGQLARMLALAAHPLGIDVRVLTAHKDDPAAQVNGPTSFGSVADFEQLKKFTEGLTALTFESEFIDVSLLKLRPETYVFPNLTAIAMIQDRLTQKRALDDFKVPTSPWLEVSNERDLEEAAERFPKGFVMKARRFGYDGYGTFMMKSADASVLAKSRTGFIAEAKIDFKRELAISIVRGRDGKTRELPLVESVQKDARCFSVVGPVKHPGLKKITQPILHMMKKLDYVGILAIELFDTPKGLVVNELAPRVHNSAHYSQNGLSCSQFEYHLRAGLGLPLPEVELIRPGFAMVNLLGEGREIALSRKPDGHLHWYGKHENRAGRKLGHINTLANTPAAALKKALRWRKDFKL